MSWYNLDPQLSNYDDVVKLMGTPNTESYLKQKVEFIPESSARLHGAYMHTSLIGETIVVLVNADKFHTTPEDIVKGAFMYCATHEQFHIDNMIASNMGAHLKYTATQDHLDMAADQVHLDRIRMHYNKLVSNQAKIGFATEAYKDFLKNTQVVGKDVNALTAANGEARRWHVILSSLQR